MSDTLNLYRTIEESDLFKKINDVKYLEDLSWRENFTEILSNLKIFIEDWLWKKEILKNIYDVIPNISLSEETELNIFLDNLSLSKDKVLSEIYKTLSERKATELDVLDKSSSSVVSIFRNKFSIIWTVLWFNPKDFKENISPNLWKSGLTWILEIISDFSKDIWNLTLIFWKKIIEKDEEIRDLTSKNNFLNEENIILDDKNFDLMERKFFLEKENIALEEKIFLWEEKILELKRSKKNIEKSRKKILKEEKDLLKEKIKSTKVSYERDEKQWELDEQNFNSNIGKEILFEEINNLENKNSSLEWEKDDLEKENNEIAVDLQKTEEQLWMVYKMIKNAAEVRKKSKEEVSDIAKNTDKNLKALTGKVWEIWEIRKTRKKLF